MFLTSGLTISGGLTIGTPSDSTSPRNTLLLSGNYGVNNGTNNTFLDSSPYAQTVTRNGDATQGSFTPYDFNYSVFFNGSSDFLTLPSNTAFVLGTGNFTIEFWVYFNSLSTTQHIIDMRGGAAAAVGVAIYMTANTIRFYTANADRITSASISTGTWYHVALVRNFGTTTMYLNGTATGSTYADTNSYIINGPFIGRFSGSAADFMNGYISNLRITRGQALYTATFTPPAVTLTTTSQGATAANVAALVCQSNRFIDNSPNNFTVTVNSGPQITAFSPFVLPFSYNPDAENAFYVGSGYFDNDYLSLASTDLLAPGTGDFTIEAWLYPTSALSTYNSVFESTAASNGLLFGKVTNGYGIRSTAVADLISTPAPAINQWVHVAASRSGTNLRLFLNGTLANTVTNSTNFATASVNIGAGNSGANPFPGYISNLRFVKGTAVYTSSFTPPTAPVQPVNNTTLLLNFTNSNIPDYTMNNNLITVGDAKLSTAVTRYNPYSIAFDGTGDYLALNFATVLTANWFSTSFTLEYWIYVNAFTQNPGGQSVIIGNMSPTTDTNYWSFGPISNGTVMWYYFNGTPQTLTTTAALVTGRWYHLAFVNNANSLAIYIDGISRATGTISGTPQIATGFGNSFIIGQSHNVAFNGYLDDLRITRGFARYTANFTPPQGPLPLA